jgi:hypothetical protein
MIVTDSYREGLDLIDLIDASGGMGSWEREVVYKRQEREFSKPSREIGGKDRR